MHTVSSAVMVLGFDRLREIPVDIDPIYAELTIRRLEHLRECGRTGWQRGNPFEAELKREKRKTVVATVDV